METGKEKNGGSNGVRGRANDRCSRTAAFVRYSIVQRWENPQKPYIVNNIIPAQPCEDCKR